MHWFGNVTRHLKELNLASTILHGRVSGNHARGRPRRSSTGETVRGSGMGVEDAARASYSRNGW